LAGGPYPSSSSLGDVVLGGLFLPALLGGAFKVQDDLAAAVDGDPRDAPAGLLDGLHGRLDVALAKGQVAAAGASELLHGEAVVLQLLVERHGRFLLLA